MLRAVAAWCCLLLMAGCADVAPDTPSPDPIHGTPEATPEGQYGRIVIELSAQPVGDNVPADVPVSFTLQPTNAIGDPLPGTLSWDLSIDGPETVQRQGTSTQYNETFTFQERGAYVVTLHASGDIHRNATATATFALDPIPLAVDLDVPTNVTRGDWSSLQANVSHGYSDITTQCTWRIRPAAFVADASACDTDVRWLEEGNHTVQVRIFDGVTNLTQTHNVTAAALPERVAPSSAPGAAQVTDADDDTRAEHLDITAAWLDSDLEHLFVGIAVDDASTAPSDGVTYSLAFSTSWNTTVDDAVVDRFRVVSDEPVDAANDVPRAFRLEADTDGAWSTIAAVAGTFDSDDGIVWWQVPRDALDAPLINGTISQPSARSTMQGDQVGIGDDASAEVDYRLE